MRILVVEDEHKIANSIKKGLEQESYAVDVAYDGEYGFDLAATEDYDAIILDLSMPEMDGMETLKHLLSENPDLQIIVLTGFASIQKGVEAIKDLDTMGMCPKMTFGPKRHVGYFSSMVLKADAKNMRFVVESPIREPKTPQL